MTDKVTARNRCPGSRTVARLTDTRGRGSCGECCRWVWLCRDGTMRSHPRVSGSVVEVPSG